MRPAMTKNRDLKTGQGKAYDVGYGKPPKATQFKKGQTGNSGGRPRKKETKGIDVISVIEQPISVTIDGAKRSMQPYEAGVRQLTRRALQEKKTRALIDLLKLFEANGCFEPPEKAQRGGVIFAPKDISPAD
jgi:hypothetical protein